MMQLSRLEPRTPREASELLSEAAGAGRRVAFAGGGTHAAPRADAPDAVLSTLALREIVEYAAEDQTVTVEAGITVAEVGRVLARNGQRLVLDVAEPERATIGGSIAANAFGARRLRYGSLKDLILGVTLVRADGTAARAGGKVVKNVAGFDLSKLMVGSYGTLALITSATLRVHPLPEKTRAVRASELPARAVWELVLAIRARQLEPAAIVALRLPDAERYRVDVLLEGFAAGVDAQASALLAPIAAVGSTAEDIDWTQASEADRHVRRGGSLRVRCIAPPADFAETDRTVIGPLVRALAGGTAAVYPSLGAVFIAGHPHYAETTREALVRARGELERRGGSLVIEAAPDASDDAVALDTWGTPPPSFPLMRQLKARFDPQARLNPGCFVGGL